MTVSEAKVLLLLVLPLAFVLFLDQSQRTIMSQLTSNKHQIAIYYERFKIADHFTIESSTHLKRVLGILINS